MNLSQLQYFCKLAELQHYTRAAEQLYITQPTLSNSIARLEEELGVPLFEREGRNVHLTKYGREFNRYALQALAALDEGKEVAREQAGEYGGTIDIGTIYTIQDGYLPALVREYRKIYGTGPMINMYQGLTRPLVSDLEDDRYDVAFGAKLEGKDNLEFVPVLHQKLTLMLHKDSPIATKKSVSLKDLHGQRIVTYREGTPLGDEVRALLHQYDLHPAEAYDDEITLASMVASNENDIGVGLDTLGISPFSNLVRVSIEDVPDDFHTIYLIYKKNSYKIPAVQHFIDLAKSFEWNDPAQTAN